VLGKLGGCLWYIIIYRNDSLISVAFDDSRMSEMELLIYYRDDYCLDDQFLFHRLINC
jgi:hypothetical protein